MRPKIHKCRRPAFCAFCLERAALQKLRDSVKEIAAECDVVAGIAVEAGERRAWIAVARRLNQVVYTARPVGEEV